MQRRDFAKNLACELLSLPIAFHPILWLTRRHMAETREQLCDALAAQAVAGPQRYARSLLRLATQFAASPNNPTPQAIGIFDAHPFKNFERRVMNLTHHSTQLRGAARLVPIALSLALIGGACTTALAFRQQVAAPQARPPPLPRQQPSSSAFRAPPPVSPRSPSKSTSPTPPAPTASSRSSPPPYAEAPQPQSAPGPHVSGSVIAGNRINFVEPIYPPDAKAAKLSGTVVMRALIGKDGTIKDLSVLSGPDEFRESALTAVHQWTYRPYLLNGNPVEVDTTITINYSLAPEPEPQPSPAPTHPLHPSRNPQASTIRPNQAMHIGGNIKPPVVLHTADPEYSRQARAAKFSGNVQVYLWV